jgi:hypothetical protein
MGFYCANQGTIGEAKETKRAGTYYSEGSYPPSISVYLENT